MQLTAYQQHQHLKTIIEAQIKLDRMKMLAEGEFLDLRKEWDTEGDLLDHKFYRGEEFDML